MDLYGVDPVPTHELRGRRQRLRQALRAMDPVPAGALLLHHPDRYYVSGTVQRGAAWIPSQGDPILFIIQDAARAARESDLAVEDVSGFTELCARLGGRLQGVSQPVGITYDVLPHALYRRLTANLPDHGFVDVAAPLRRVRAKKTEYEIAQIREAAAMLHAMITRLPQRVQVGMSELEAAAVLETELRREGHQGLIRTRMYGFELFYGTLLAGFSGLVPSYAPMTSGGVGPTTAVPLGAGHRPLAHGDWVYLDYVGASGGYLADQTRCFACGPAHDRPKAFYRLACTICDHLAAKARPGTPVRDLYRAAWQLVEESDLAGARDTFMNLGGRRIGFLGHGVGLELDEWPVVTEKWHEPLEAGHVLALEPTFHLPGHGAVGVEDTYVVRGDGGQRLTPAPRQIIELPLPVPPAP